jgi:hypothetical protein
VRYLPAVLILLGVVAWVVINAGGGREGLKVGQSILIVVGGLILMAALFALLVTKPNL